MKTLIVEHHGYRGPLRVGSHHVAAAFLERGDDLIWISHPRSLLHLAHGPLAPTIQEHNDKTLELTPRVLLPYVRFPIVGTAWWGRRWLTLGSGARHLLARHGADRCDLLWLSDFTMLGLLDLVEARTVVWRFFDRLEYFDRMPSTVFDLVAHYKDRVDLIVASSLPIVEDLKSRGIDATYLPNAAPIGDFVPSASAGYSPRVVYIGALDSWFDLPTVEYWAAALPGVRFELGGPNPRGLASELSNVRFLGPIESTEVPQFLSGARFGIIPFERNDLTLGVHPLKLYDYLSAGCPVLSVDIPEVRTHQAGVFTYRTPEEGLEILRGHLETHFDRERLRQIADGNRWPARLAPVLRRLGLSPD